MPARPPAPALLASLLLIGALPGCTGDPVAEETTPPAAISPVHDDPQAVPSADGGTAPADPEVGVPSSDPSAHAPSDDDPQTATVVRRMWPDADWSVTDLPGNACAGTLPEATDWGLGEDYFRCGTPDRGLLVCHVVEGGERGDALCVRDPLAKEAVRIRAGMLDSFTSFATEMPYPLVVVLADGTVCSATLRDDVEHRGGRQSWLHCGEDSALLLDQSTATVYFDHEEPVWTAQLARGMDAPEEVPVREVYFAATEEDMNQHGFAQGWDGQERDDRERAG